MTIQPGVTKRVRYAILEVSETSAFVSVEADLLCNSGTHY